MKESVAITKEADTKKEFSPTDNSIHRARNEPERQLGSLRSVINNIRRDGGTPSVESIATELSVMPYSDSASALLALQQTHGNQYVQRVVTGIQAKLAVGQPGDKYEQEADRVADAVMRMPEPQVQRQVGEGELIQAKSGGDATPEVTHDFESQINTIRGGGKPLSESERAFFEPRFGVNFGQVRVHTGIQAAESAQVLNARAYTLGQDVVFGEGQHAPETSAGKRLLAHELTHVVQQASSTVIQRVPNNVSNIDRLRQFLQDDRENEAIALMGSMGRLSPEEVRTVLASREFKELAMDAFNNDEMYRGIRAMRGDLYRSLEWMFDEGTDWEKVRDVIRAPSGKDRVRTDNWMKEQFVSICNDEEMAEAVDSLGGTLLQKLRWMAAEGSNWDLVKTKLQDSTIPQTEKTDLYNHDSMKNFFVSVCNNEEMAEAVGLLGGTLLQKLTWMLAEGTNAELVYSVIRRSPTGELPAVSTNRDVMDGLRSELSRSEFERVRQMLRGLLHWEEMERGATEQHYERETPTSPWELETFGWTTAYEIQYTRTELKVIVRIELTGETTTAAQRNLWIRGIQNRWNSHFHIENSRRLSVVFEPVFTSTNSHHTVEIHAGHGRANMTNWYIRTTGDIAAHEFGHMVGLEDEYRLTRADYIRLIGTAPPPRPEPPGYTMSGLMTAGTGPVQGRHLRPFVAWLNRHRLPGERNYRLVAGPI